LELKPLGRWQVGLRDFSHSPIMDSKYDIEDDKIKFVETMNLHGVLNLNNFIFYSMMFAKNPSIYTKSYFNEFIDANLLKDFPANFENFKTDINEKNTIFKVLFAELKTIDNNVVKVEVDFDSKITYTMHQILFKIFLKFEEILTSKTEAFSLNCENNKGTSCDQNNHTFDFIYNVNNKEMRAYYLYNIGVNIIDIIEKVQNKLYKNKSPRYVNYMFIYTDVILPRHVGENFNNVLHICPIKEFDNQYNAIKNVQYYNVNKDTISNITIKILDENGENISFKSGFFPTSVTLHFRKII
jgi:hypothetical protein